MIMKNIFLAIFIFVFISSFAYADWNDYETKKDAYDRRSWENYNTYQNSNYQQPLGGYDRPMNDNGGRQYGTNYGNTGFNNLNSNHSNNHSRNSNSWNSF